MQYNPLETSRNQRDAQLANFSDNIIPTQCSSKVSILIYYATVETFRELLAIIKEIMQAVRSESEDGVGARAGGVIATGFTCSQGAGCNLHDNINYVVVHKVQSNCHTGFTRLTAFRSHYRLFEIRPNEG